MASFELKIKVIGSIEKIGICKSAELYGVDRKTASKWYITYKSDGIESLRNRSRIGQFHPNKFNESLLAEAKSMYKNGVNFSKIKRDLNLECSLKTLIKYLKRESNNPEQIDLIDKSNSFYIEFFKISKFNFVLIYTMKENLVKISPLGSFSLDQIEPIFKQISQLNSGLSGNIYIKSNRFGSRVFNNKDQLTTLTSKNQNLILENRSLVNRKIDIDDDSITSILEATYRFQINFNDFSKVDNNLYFFYPKILEHSKVRIKPLLEIIIEKQPKLSTLLKIFSASKRGLVIHTYFELLEMNEIYNINSDFEDDIFNIKLTEKNLSRAVLYLIRSKLFYRLDIDIDHYLPLIIDNKDKIEVEAQYCINMGDIKKGVQLYQSLIKSTNSHQKDRFYLKLVHSYLLYGEFEKAIKIIDNLDIIKLSIKNKIDYYNNKFAISINNNDIDDCEKCCSEYSKYINEDIRPSTIFIGLANSGRLALEMGKFDDAKRDFDRYYALAIEKGSNYLIGNAYSQLGLYYWHIKEFKKSLNTYLKCEKILSKTLDIMKLLMIKGNVSLLYHLNDLNLKSIKKSKEFLKISKSLENDQNLSTGYNYIGLAALASGNDSLADRSFRKQIKYGKKCNDYRTTAFSYNNLAMISFRYGKLKSVIINFSRSYEILLMIDSRYSIDVFVNIVEYYINRKKYSISKKNIIELEALVKKYGMEDHFRKIIEDFKERVLKLKLERKKPSVTA